MTRAGPAPTPGTGETNQPDEAWVAELVRATAGDAEAAADLLADFLTLLFEVAITGRRPRDDQLAALRHSGRRAAEHALPPGRAVDLCLSAAWRMWRELPDVPGHRDRDAVRASAEAILRAVGEAVSVLVDSYQAAGRAMIRWEEALRRQMIDDLLRGDADVARMVERAEPFGLDLGSPHVVALAAAEDGSPPTDAAAGVLERVVVDRYGDRDVLVAAKEDILVVLVPANDPRTGSSARHDAGDVVHGVLTRHQPQRRWRVATGRAYPGAYGIARSYEEARDALNIAERLRSPAPVVRAEDMLIYRVLLRDQAAMVDLIHAVLAPLVDARGGAEPLLATLESYFASGGVATETALRLGISVRTVTYRLAKVRTLTGYDAADPTQRFTLHTAVLGARLLEWPVRPLSAGD